AIWMLAASYSLAALKAAPHPARQQAARTATIHLRFIGRPSAQVIAIRCDDLLVPVERLLAQAGEVAGAVVVAADIDETIPLGVLAGGRRYQVDAAPGGIAHQVHTVLDCLFHLFDVAAQVVNAVVVADS